MATQALHGQGGGAGRQARPGAIQGQIKGPPHPGDLVLLAQAGDRREDRREQMSVLMGVEMSRADSGGEDPFHLVGEFRVNIPAAEGEIPDEGGDGFRKHPAGLAEAGALHHLQMYSDVESWVFRGEADCIIKGSPIGHQGCGGENAFPVGTHNPRIHVSREAEVVGVDDEITQLRKGRA